MPKVEFAYNGQIIEVLCLESDKMEEICKKFIAKAKMNQSINNFSFLYSGNQLNLQLTFSEVINSIDKQRKIISILVYDLNPPTIIKCPKIVKSAFPICKKCDENMKFELENYKIRCSGCKKGHSIALLINEYEKYQTIDISKIVCHNCSVNKFKTYGNQMFVCNSCKINLCPICKDKHDKNHNLVDYDLKNYICPRHNESYISFCKTCKINICFNCQLEHNMHDIILIGDILPDKNE